MQNGAYDNQPLNNPQSSGGGGWLGGLFGNKAGAEQTPSHLAQAQAGGAAGWQQAQQYAAQGQQFASQGLQQGQQYASQGQQYASQGQQYASQGLQQGQQYADQHMPQTGYPQQGPDAAIAGAQSLDDFSKNVQWTLLFFGAACCTLAAGVIAAVYLCLNFFNASTWSPFNLVGSVFMIGSGILGLVLDVPAQVSQAGGANMRLMKMRHSVYIYLLFMTRFCGRGAWYFFLGSQCWLVLYDSKINRILAVILTLYIVLVGVGACVKGFLLSQKLHAARAAIKTSGQQDQSLSNAFVKMANMAGADPSMSREEFRALINKSMGGQPYFTEDELSYVIGALSFKASSDGKVSMKEMEYWMKDGPLLLI